MVLVWAARTRFSGGLHFSRGERKKSVFLEHGVLRGSASNLVPETIETAIRQNLFESHRPKDLVDLLTDFPADLDFTKRILFFLKGKELLDDFQEAQVLEKLNQERLLNLLGWFEGDFKIRTEETLPDASIPAQDDLLLFALLQDIEGTLDGKVESSLLLNEKTYSKGNLKETSATALFVNLAARGATGTLLLERGERRKLIKFRHGQIVSAASTSPHETLGMVLKRWNYLDSATADRLENQARHEGQRFRTILLEESALDDLTLREALLVLQLERGLECFGWRSGQFEFQGQMKKAKLLPRKSLPKPLKKKSEDTDTETNLIHLALKEIAGKIQSLDSAKDQNLPIIFSISPWTSITLNTLLNLRNILDAEESSALLLTKKPAKSTKNFEVIEDESLPHPVYFRSGLPSASRKVSGGKTLEQVLAAENRTFIFESSGKEMGWERRPESPSFLFVPAGEWTGREIDEKAARLKKTSNFQGIVLCRPL